MRVTRIAADENGVREDFAVDERLFAEDEIAMDAARFADAGHGGGFDEADVFAAADVFAEEFQNGHDLLAARQHDGGLAFRGGSVDVRNAGDVAAPCAVAALVEAKSFARNGIFACGHGGFDFRRVAHGHFALRGAAFKQFGFVDAFDGEEQSGGLHFASLVVAFEHGAAGDGGDVAVARAVDDLFRLDEHNAFLRKEEDAFQTGAVLLDVKRLDAVQNIDASLFAHLFGDGLERLRIERRDVAVAFRMP